MQMESLCMECQSLFPGKNKKKISKMSTETFAQSDKRLILILS